MLPSRCVEGIAALVREPEKSTYEKSEHGHCSFKHACFMRGVDERIEYFVSLNRQQSMELRPGVGVNHDLKPSENNRAIVPNQLLQNCIFLYLILPQHCFACYIHTVD